MSSSLGSILLVRRPDSPGQGTKPWQSDEIRDLLRSRLILVCVIILAPTVLLRVFITLDDLLNPVTRPLDALTYYPDVRSIDFLYFIVIGGMAAALIALQRRWNHTLRRLRLIEFFVFGLALAVLIWSQFLWYQSGWLKGVAMPGKENPFMLVTGDSMSFPWFLMIVLYGTMIPNTGRRCAVVVLSIMAIGVASTLFLALPDDPLAPYIAKDVSGRMTTWLAIGAAMAIYGSHRISALHAEAMTSRKLGQYHLKERLGAGGMGEVYRAEHRLLRRDCAVKVIRPDQAADAESLERFEREVQVMATLNNPHAVDIYDYGRADDGTFYYAMEFLPGLDLDQLSERYGPLLPERVVHLLMQVCSVLSEAHSVGLIHRDIKPGNIIVSERGGVFDFAKLLDFGLVQASTLPSDDRLTTRGALVGTPLYMSPEQAEGSAALDARTDIYSLGAVAYLLLTAQPVFVRDSAMRVLAAHISEPVTPPTVLKADLPADLEEVILRCLEKTPARRFSNVRAMSDALAECACANGWTQEKAEKWWREHEMKARQGSEGSGALGDNKSHS